MHIHPNRRQQSGTQASIRQAGKSANAYAQAAQEQSNVHFSFEATLLYELIGKYGDISGDLQPWYFPEAYLHNAEKALSVASRIVNQASMAHIQMDLNFVFKEIRELNHIHFERDIFQPHSAELAKFLEIFVAAHEGFSPGKNLADSDRNILQLLHDFAIRQGNPVSQVEDFALLYALTKFENRASDTTVQLNGNTAKYLVQHHLDLIDPDFVPLLIDFYKTHKEAIAHRLVNTEDQH